jgi:hypothetical protein
MDGSSIQEVDDTFFSVNEFGSMLIGHEPHHQMEMRSPYLNYVMQDDDRISQVVDTTDGRRGPSEIKISHAAGRPYRATDDLQRAVVLFYPGRGTRADPLLDHIKKMMLQLGQLLASMNVTLQLLACDVTKYPTALLLMRTMPGGGPSHMPAVLYFADRVVVFPPLLWIVDAKVDQLPTVEGWAHDVVRARRVCKSSVI